MLGDIAWSNSLFNNEQLLYWFQCHALVSISVIISTYGMERIDDTHQSIESVLLQMDDESELIVVIDENDELVSNLAEKFGDRIRIEISKEKGLSNARNLGVRAAKGNIVAFIDDDATICPGWIKAIRAGLSSDNKIAAVTGTIFPDWIVTGMEWVPRPLYWIVSCTYIDIEDGEFVQTAIGTNMAFRKDVLLDMGGFNSKLGAVQNWRKIKGSWVQKMSLVGEERDLCIKLARSGYKVINSSNMCVKHKVYPYRLTFKNLMNRGYREGLTKGHLKRKYADGEEDALSLEQEYIMHTLASLMDDKDKPLLSRLRGMFSLFFVFVSVFTGFFVYLVSGKKNKHC